MAKTRPPYTPEFRRQMVELVRAGRSPRNWRRSLNRPRSRSGTGSARLSATAAVARRADNGRARGAQPAAA